MIDSSPLNGCRPPRALGHAFGVGFTPGIQVREGEFGVPGLEGIEAEKNGFGVCRNMDPIAISAGN
ncbi:hypothetical protein [Bordetella sp. FB-8]|uniref:hypothetical protein n=1 Tax=Bordetella sp. FB-8 TaxID=1159870 RepID=UPI00039C01F1|nr:hypothetical protein [Bordetella sp. FB-8]